MLEIVELVDAKEIGDDGRLDALRIRPLQACMETTQVARGTGYLSSARVIMARATHEPFVG